MEETNKHVKLLKQLIKDKLVEQLVRIQIQPIFSWTDKDMKKACNKYNISEEEFRIIIKSESSNSKVDTPFKELFGFYPFNTPFDELSFIVSDGIITEVNKDALHCLSIN
jgi:hypothetical protein